MSFVTVIKRCFLGMALLGLCMVTVPAASADTSSPVTTPALQVMQFTGPAADALDPVILWNGDRNEYAMVWSDNRLGNFRIYFNRLTPDGKRILNNDIQVNPGMGWAFKPSIAWNGKEYLVLWRDDRNKVHDLYTQRVSAEGALIGRDNNIRHGVWHTFNPELQYNKDLGQYVAVWDDVRVPFGTSRIYLAQLDQEGRKIQDELPLTDIHNRGDAYAPTVGWNGREYLTLWQDNSDGWKYKLLRMRMEPNGIKHSADGDQVLDPNRTGFTSDPRMVYNGHNYGLVFTQSENEGKQVFFAQLDRDGNLVRERAITDPRLNLNTTGTPEQDLLLQQRYPYLRSSFAYRVGTNTDIFRSEKADLTFNGSAYGVVWQDNREGNEEVYFTEIDEQGNLLRQDFLNVSNTKGDSLDPRVAYNGRGYAIVWRDTGDNPNNDRSAIYLALLGGIPETKQTIQQPALVTPPAPTLSTTVRPRIEAGDFIQGSTGTVYRIGTDSRRHAYPDILHFVLWGNNPSEIKHVGDDVLAAFPLGAANALPPHSRIVRFQSSKQLYSIEDYQVLKLIRTPKEAMALYGKDWGTKIIVLPDTQMSNYTVEGSGITQPREVATTTSPFLPMPPLMPLHPTTLLVVPPPPPTHY